MKKDPLNFTWNPHGPRICARLLGAVGSSLFRLRHAKVASWLILSSLLDEEVVAKTDREDSPFPLVAHPHARRLLMKNTPFIVLYEPIARRACHGAKSHERWKYLCTRCRLFRSGLSGVNTASQAPVIQESRRLSNVQWFQYTQQTFRCVKYMNTACRI